jgi:hypothetical protein
VTELLEHLDRQIDSSRRLLGIVLAQGKAIRARDVEGVLARLTELQAEMVQRTQLEHERDSILRRASAELGLALDDVDLEAMLASQPYPEAERARSLSAELRGLVTETARLHEQNRVLLRQELSFLDHLMRVLSGSPQGGYTPSGFGQAPQLVSALDARA